MKIVIGSRGSDLALWQAHFVQDQLRNLGHDIEIKIISTKGDRIQDLSFDKIEGKGFFTKEIEEALLNKEIDLAVHSHKDLETTNPEGLIIGAVSYREDPTDILLIHPEAFEEGSALNLKDNAVIGTSSARRKTQLLRLKSGIEIKDLRGNVPTRVNKLMEGQYDAIVLASAGINRLQLDLGKIRSLRLEPELFIPAPAQGVLGLQIREDDAELASVLNRINHPDVAACIRIERQVLNQMEGGCQLPLGVFCEEVNGGYRTHVSYATDKDAVADVFVYEGINADEIVSEIIADLKREA